ncbi:MAG: UDP-3-O-(3-hydroxymyristoyl)glucosamine N-acyltransferase [Planctomycetes bacterium]|nr:UDP-3-O-(3-hydroxymyristoyl)glucosamine N-acyltransferase [Planctomycetota bacterium]MCB9887077.1 UDP-3-O-(3-hydroxymyristoyl)glucosamine N-acyltransferase [Planctomycetota bacterium]
MTDVTVAAIAAMVDGRLRGDGERIIRGLGDLRTASGDRLGFVRHQRYAELARATKAGAVLSAIDLQTPASLVLVEDVHVAYAKVATFFHPPPRAVENDVHPRASVDDGAELEGPVRIGANATVGKCKIGAGTVIMPGVVILDGAVIGRDCVLYPNVTIYGGVRLGDRVILHGGTVIGSDGFGFARDQQGWLKVPQLGGVVIEDDVEFQAGCVVDRGALGDTRIGAGSKFDNHCHIAHNVVIGRDVVMAAGCSVAGSATVGDRCIFAGLVGINGHCNVAADVRIGGGTNLFKDLNESGDYMGNPTVPLKEHVRMMRKLKQMGRESS